MIVITGTAGVGKTSLALRWAHRVRERFAGGQLYANLRGYDPGPPATATQTEAPNLVGAVQTASTVGEHALAWQLAVVLGGIYMHQNAFHDWVATGQVGVDSAIHLGDRAAHARTLESLGKAYFQSRRLDDAEACHRRGLAIRGELDDRFGEAVSVNALGLLALRRRRLDEAAAHFRQGARMFADVDERRWEALLRGNLAETLCERGEFDAADRLLRDALATLRELGDRFGEGDVLFRLSWAHRGAGRLRDAYAAIEHALAIADAETNQVWRAHWLTERARVALAHGNAAEALTDSQHAAVIQRQLGDRSREATAIDLAGQAYQLLDRHDEAARFHRQAAGVHRDLGDGWQLARTLDHLATVLERASQEDREEQARQCRREAVSLLAAFDDPLAAAARERLSRTLADR